VLVGNGAVESKALQVVSAGEQGRALMSNLMELVCSLPPKKLLEQKIHKIVAETRELFERNKQQKQGVSK